MSARKVGDNQWDVPRYGYVGGDAYVASDPLARLVSIPDRAPAPTGTPTLPTPGTLLHTLTDDDLDRLPEGSRFVADADGWRPLTKRGKKWQYGNMDDADMDFRRESSRERANYRLHLPSGAE